MPESFLIRKEGAVDYDEGNDLYKTLVGMNPELKATAMLIERAREVGLKYPVNCCDDFLPLAEQGCRHCDLDGVKVSITHAKRFFPKNFFPVENEDALMGRLIAAFTWGNEVHRFEARMAAAAAECEGEEHASSR